MGITRVLGLCVVALVFGVVGTQAVQADRDADSIRKLLTQYQQVLNAGSVDGVMKLYTVDGVFMPTDAPAQSGAPAIRQYYERETFGSTSYKLTFTPVEVTTTGDWGFARVNFTGTTSPKGGGSPVRIDNKALFILRRTTDGSWRIARYIFNRNAAATGSQE